MSANLKVRIYVPIRLILSMVHLFVRVPTLVLSVTVKVCSNVPSNCKLRLILVLVDFWSPWVNFQSSFAGLRARKSGKHHWVWAPTLARFNLRPAVSSGRGLCKGALGRSTAAASHNPWDAELHCWTFFNAPACCPQPLIYRKRVGCWVSGCTRIDPQIPVQVCYCGPLQASEKVINSPISLYRRVSMIVGQWHFH